MVVYDVVPILVVLVTVSLFVSAETLAINDITVEEMTAIAAIRFTIFFTTNFLSAQNELSMTALCCQNLVFSAVFSADCLLCTVDGNRFGLSACCRDCENRFYTICTACKTAFIVRKRN